MIRPSLALLLIASAVPAAEAHDWYTDLRDGEGKSCCNMQDCRPVGQCVMPDRKEGLLIEGACQPVPWDKVLGMASPDGGAHACWNRRGGGPNVLCVILPGEV